jgi:hypothetical protein
MRAIAAADPGDLIRLGPHPSRPRLEVQARPASRAAAFWRTVSYASLVAIVLFLVVLRRPG